MPCSYCGIPGCNIDTCPERLEDKYGRPTKYLDDEDDSDDDEPPAAGARSDSSSTGVTGP